VLAFTYIVVIVVIAFEVPLAINLQRRATSDVKQQSLLSAQTIAARVGGERTFQPKQLQRFVFNNFPHTEDGRVIVIDPRGVLIADSTGPTSLGETYATPDRPELQTVLANQQPDSEIRFSDTLGQSILVAAAPILDESTFYGVVRQSHALGEVQDRVRRLIIGLAIIGFAALLAGLLIAFALASSLSRPLSRLAQAAKRLGEGDLSTRTNERAGASEITELAGSFDDMAGRLESAVKAQREFVANASHQLRTPLTGMKLCLESAIDQTQDAEVKRQLEAANAEVDRLAETVERLLVMARRIEEGGPSEIDLRQTVARAVGRWEQRASRLGATLQITGGGGRALGESADLDQILDNLLDNAIAYAPGPIVIETGRGDGHVFIAVEDHGAGMAPDDLARATDRFFRGKGAPAGGSGLGLAIVRDLAERSGGSVLVEAGTSGGTRVEVRLEPVALTSA
jgi:two-component system, OmpR family, sensor kinase